MKITEKLIYWLIYINSRWLQGECKDKAGKEDAQKGQLQPCQANFLSALSTGQSLESVSEHEVHLGTPLTFIISLFLQGDPHGLSGWAEAGFHEYSSQLKEKGRRVHRGISGEREEHQSPRCSVIRWGTASGLQMPFSDANVLFWGNSDLWQIYLVSSRKDERTDKVRSWTQPPNSRKKASNPFSNGFSPAHLAAWGADPRKELSVFIIRDYADILLMQNSIFIPIFLDVELFWWDVEEWIPMCYVGMKAPFALPIGVKTLAWCQNIPSSLIHAMPVSNL